jgi:hypothetical protein
MVVQTRLRIPPLRLWDQRRSAPGDRRHTFFCSPTTPGLGHPSVQEWTAKPASRAIMSKYRSISDFVCTPSRNPRHPEDRVHQPEVESARARRSHGGPGDQEINANSIFEAMILCLP